MKKLMTLMLGLALFTGSVATTFAQEKKEGTEEGKKKGKKKKSEEPKKESR